VVRHLRTCGFLLAVCVSCSCDRHPDISGSAEVLQKAALSRAKKEGKQLFLLFTTPGASWCERFEAYHADPEVQRVLGKYFVLLRIDRIETPGGEHMYVGYGGTGSFPAFSILASDGMLLANSGDGDQNVGFPTTPDEVARYFAALKAACPKLSDDEVELLRAKLESLRPKEDSPADAVKPEPSARAPACRRFLRTAGRFA
jgi:uncharacterized protein DUF255